MKSLFELSSETFARDALNQLRTIPGGNKALFRRMLKDEVDLALEAISKSKEGDIILRKVSEHREKLRREAFDLWEEHPNPRATTSEIEYALQISWFDTSPRCTRIHLNVDMILTDVGDISYLRFDEFFEVLKKTLLTSPTLDEFRKMLRPLV